MGGRGVQDLESPLQLLKHLKRFLKLRFFCCPKTFNQKWHTWSNLCLWQLLLEEWRKDKNGRQGVREATKQASGRCYFHYSPLAALWLQIRHIQTEILPPQNQCFDTNIIYVHILIRSCILACLWILKLQRFITDPSTGLCTQRCSMTTEWNSCVGPLDPCDCKSSKTLWLRVIRTLSQRTWVQILPWPLYSVRPVISNDPSMPQAFFVPKTNTVTAPPSRAEDKCLWSVKHKINPH